MKQRFLSYSSNLIRKYHPEYDDIKMEECRYNLEGFYLTMSKAIIILPAGFFIGIMKEMIILLFIFNFIRKQAHGLHATKSWICLVSSSTIFIGLPLLAKRVSLSLIYIIILEFIALFFIILFAPADTKKAPIIRKEKRRYLKKQAVIYCLLLIVLTTVVKNQTLQNLIVFGIWTAVIMILPLTYKLFKLPYNNYKTYLSNMN